MNNSLKTTKNIINIVLGAFVLIVSLVYFIKSKEVWADEYGTDISFNSDYVVAMIIGVIISVHGVAQLLNSNQFTSVICNITASGVICFYSLGCFFKPLMKALSKNVAFEFVNYQAYLYIGILTLILFAYYIVSYFDIKKQNNK